MSTLVNHLRVALRRKTWVPEDSAPFFHMAQKVARHARRRFDITDLEKAIAYCVYAEMSSLQERSPAQEPLYDAARLVFESCMPDKFGPIIDRACEEARKDGYWVPSPQRIRWICEERMDRDSAERIALHGDPYKAIEEAVKKATLAHPRLGLSFGYIGNVGIHGDDRVWYVFAKLATPRCVNACDVHFGGCATDVIEDLADMIGEPFQNWLAQCEQRLDAGEIRMVGPRSNDQSTLAA